MPVIKECGGKGLAHIVQGCLPVRQWTAEPIPNPTLTELYILKAHLMNRVTNRLKNVLRNHSSCIGAALNRPEKWIQALIPQGRTLAVLQYRERKLNVISQKHIKCCSRNGREKHEGQSQPLIFFIISGLQDGSQSNKLFLKQQDFL